MMVQMYGKPQSELMALLALIDEPDEEIFGKVRNRILDFGNNAMYYLEKDLSLVENETQYNRIEELIEDINYKVVFDRLKKWTKTNRKDLITAWIILSKFLARDVDEEPLKDSFFKIFKDVWLEMNNRLTALEKMKVLNHVIYKVYRFSEFENGNPPTTYIAESFLRFNQGNSLTMGMFYLAIAQRLGLPVFGVNLPQHFILAYVDEHDLIKSAEQYSVEDVLFYINPYNKGAVFTKNEVDLFLDKIKTIPQDSYYKPCNNFEVLHRYIHEVETVWKNEGKIYKATLMNGFYEALNPSNS